MVNRAFGNRIRAREFFDNFERLAIEGRNQELQPAMSDIGHHTGRSHVSEESPGPSRNFACKNCGNNAEIQRLVEQISSMYMDEECSDVTLIVEGTMFPAHRSILAARSIYFKAMFFGGMRESREKSVELQETPVQAFRLLLLLKYIYTGTLQLQAIKIDLVFDILGLVHKYGFIELEQTVSDYLQTICNAENVCLIFSVSQLYSMKSLASFCLDYVDNYAAEVIKQPNFCQLSAVALEQIISRDSFCAPEIDIFKAVTRWMESNPEESTQFGHLIFYIRLSLIKLEDLLNIIRPSGLIPADVLLDAINDQTKKKSTDLVYRGFLTPNTNVISSTNGASVISGDVPSYELEKGTIKHTIGERDPGIVIQLGKPYIINNIKVQLADRDQRSFSYFVEVSMDQKDWVRVIDHTKYLCRHKQNLLFPKRVVKFIRICGTSYGALQSNTFQISNIEAMYSPDVFDIDPSTTLQIPRRNIATIKDNALVIEGVSRCRNALLNGDTKNYDWDNGYTCHQLGSGNITVQLPQPYLIDSIGLLLWDCDDRTYSYFIEVSVDQTNWTKVVSEEKVSSWRKVFFDLQPVVFIKIVGTYNSANEVFHCVHFECPAVFEDASEVASTSSSTKQFPEIGEQVLAGDEIQGIFNE
uniref:BTB domain-containing protein n=2 Tax=Panagrolaimus sp. JU765 TaxID=591449 RepID=A0AC34R9G0_9BILA